jgi:hypothetical protein
MAISSLDDNGHLVFENYVCETTHLSQEKEAGTISLSGVDIFSDKEVKLSRPAIVMLDVPNVTHIEYAFRKYTSVREESK